MKALEFRKYHGLGNDFLVVEARTLAGSPRPGLTPDRVRRLCDRRRGVGGDGVLVVGPGQQAPVAMEVHNADGSRAEMCGNGLRCVARYAVDHLGVPGPSFVVETGAGLLPVTVESGDVVVQMGPADDLGRLTVEVDGAPLVGRSAALGNPHLVLYGEWSPADVARLGPHLEHHPAFARGVNVSFARRRGPRHVELAVWERGCGPTLACGTGACATVAVGWREALLASDGAEVRVDLPGGTLYIGGTPDAVTMRGPAVEVFRGVVALDAWDG